MFIKFPFYFKGNSINKLLRSYFITISITLVFCAIPLVFYSKYIDSYSEAKWIFLYLSSAVLAIAILFNEKSLNFFRLRNWQITLLFCLFIAFAQNILRYGWLFQERVFLDRLLFVIWSWIIFQALTKEKHFIKILSFGFLLPTSLILTLIFWGKLGFTVKWLPEGANDQSHFFGNHNYVAEYLAYVLVLFLFALREEGQSYRKMILEWTIGASLVCILFLNCRAVFLGLLFALIYMVFVIRLVSKSSMIRISLISLFFYFLPSFPGLLHHSPDLTKLELSRPIANILNKTSSSIYERVYIWQDSLTASLANPSGIGSGNFSFGHILASLENGRSQLREYAFWQHPHNELIRFLVEDGWLFTAFLIIFFLSLIWVVLKNIQQLKKTGDLSVLFQKKWQILLSLSCIFLLSSSLSFPLYLSFSFLIAAFLTSILLDLQGETSTVEINKTLMILPVFIVSALFFSLAKRIDFAEYVSKQKLDSEFATAKACRQLPTHWPVCLAAVHAHIVNQHFSEAESILDSILDRAPFHYPALKMQAFLAEQKNNGFDECMTLWLYDAILKEQSSLTKHKNKVCRPEFLQDLSIAKISAFIGHLPQLKH